MSVLLFGTSLVEAELIHHWKLDADANDSAGNMHLNEFGSPTYVTGQIGNAISLDGSTKAVGTLPSTASAISGGLNPFPIGADFSWTFWIRKDDTDRDWIGGTQNSASGVHFFADTTNEAEFRAASAVTVVDNTIPTSTWVHIAITYDDSGSTTVYADGTQIGTDSGPNPTAVLNFTIGKRPDGTAFFNGLIDDMAIFDHVLSADERDNVMNFGAEEYLGSISLSGNTISSSYPPPTYMGNLTYVHSSANTDYTLGTSGDNLLFMITSSDNAMIGVLSSNSQVYSGNFYNITISANSNSGNATTRDFNIGVISGAPQLVVAAKTSFPLIDGRTIATMVWNSGGSAITYSLISGREDLFTISSNNLKVANSSDWAGIGTDYYVTVQAINAASQSSSFTIKVAVVSSAKGTIIRFD